MNSLQRHADQILAVLAVLWGLFAGALVPRVAHRLSVDAEEEWRGRCPQGHPIDGWVGLARCRACGGTPYGPGTPPAAVVTALVCLLLALATGPRPELAVWLVAAPAGVLLAIVDFRVKRLPDPVTLPLAAVVLGLLGLAALVPEHAGSWTGALLGALVLAAFYYVLFLVNSKGMGFGDVKLALATGGVLGFYGWPTVVLGTFAGFLFAALYGLALVVARRAGRRTLMPFGPFLLTGALLGLLMGAYAA